MPHPTIHRNFASRNKNHDGQIEYHISSIIPLGVPSYALPIEETAEDSARVKDIEEVVIVYSPKETGKLRQAPIAVSLFDRTALDDQLLLR